MNLRGFGSEITLLQEASSMALEQDRISPQIGEAEPEGETLLIYQLRYARTGR